MVLQILMAYATWIFGAIFFSFLTCLIIFDKNVSEPELEIFLNNFLWAFFTSFEFFHFFMSLSFTLALINRRGLLYSLNMLNMISLTLEVKDPAYFNALIKAIKKAIKSI